MKKIAIIILFAACFAPGGFAQTVKTESKSKAEVRAVLDAFMECVKTKNAEKFYSLFHENPVVWIGVYKEKSQQKRVEKNAALKNKNFDADDYKTFFQGILGDKNVEEKFYNIVIEEDVSIASVSFDYSFWAAGKRTNWGKESWGLIKAGGQWKITSVIYSVEFEKVEKEPRWNKANFRIYRKLR